MKSQQSADLLVLWMPPFPGREESVALSLSSCETLVEEVVLNEACDELPASKVGSLTGAAVASIASGLP